MSERVAQNMNTAGVVALAAACILAYSLWGASVLRAEHNAAFSAGNPQTQVARGN
jgi:hypothetical protein